jgi:hypothetical protein
MGCCLAAGFGTLGRNSVPFSTGKLGVFRRSQKRPRQGAESLIALLRGGRIACVVPILRTSHLRVCAAISARENAEIAVFDDCIVGPASDRAARDDTGGMATHGNPGRPYQWLICHP